MSNKQNEQPSSSKRSADYKLDFFKTGKKAKAENTPLPLDRAPSRVEPTSIENLAVRNSRDKPEETIEFVVTFKSSLKKTLTNKDVFSFDCFDGTTEIGCSAFGEQAIQLHSQIKVLRSYVLENFTVKPAAPAYNRSTTSELQLYAERQTLLYVSEKVFPSIPLELSPLEEIVVAAAETKLNVVGIVVAQQPVVVSDRFKRHEIAIVDDSKETVWINLWDDNAEVPIKMFSSVILRRAEVQSRTYVDSDTKKTTVLQSLTVNSQRTGFWVNSDYKEAMELKAWFEQNKPESEGEED